MDQLMATGTRNFRGWPYGDSTPMWEDKPLPVPKKVKGKGKKKETCVDSLRALTARPSRKQRIALGLELP